MCAMTTLLGLRLTLSRDLQHHLFLLTFGGLHVAPLPPALHNVLDIGTGTGLWAIEFGRDSLAPKYFRSISNRAFCSSARVPHGQGDRG